MSGYIMDLRQVVGHRTLIQAAASIICVDAEGRLLLGRRTDNHMWGYSGGAVEIDEKIEDCARRELFEEMGITAGELELFYINSPTLKLSIYAGITGERSGHSRKRLKRSGISLSMKSRWRKSPLQSVRFCRSTKRPLSEGS